MSEKERNKRLMLMIQKLLHINEIESIELLETMVAKDTLAMIKSFSLMTENISFNSNKNNDGKGNYLIIHYPTMIDEHDSINTDEVIVRLNNKSKEYVDAFVEGIKTDKPVGYLVRVEPIL